MPKAKDSAVAKKHAGGRPTDYRPEYCAEIIACMSDGYSVMGFAGSISAARQTVYQWAEVYPEFNDALKIARTKSAQFWENRHIAISNGGEGNVTATIFALKNRAADEWREKVEVSHSGNVSVETRFVFELPGDSAKLIEAQ